ncbi:MAG: hypothetical protein OEY34_00330 [Cyclobacteriaceae bacterium]|nr:hypothetical protein [Cyclobacteriaceae bacterium]
MKRILMAIMLLLSFPFIVKSQNVVSLVGINSTQKSPFGFTYGGVFENGIFCMWARLSPNKFFLSDYDKEYDFVDGELIGPLDPDELLLYSGLTTIHRASIGYQYGRKFSEHIIGYFGLGYGRYITIREYNSYFLGSNHGLLEVGVKSKSSVGVETEVGLMILLGENLIVHGGVSTVNFRIDKVGIDPSFGIMFLMRDKSQTKKSWNKYRRVK